MQIHFNEQRNELVVQFKYDAALVATIKAAPTRKFESKDKSWRLPCSKANVQFIQANFPSAEISHPAQVAMHNANLPPKRYDLPSIDLPDGVKPREWQRSVLQKAWRRDFALFWQMRLGKTFVVVTLAAEYWHLGYINSLVVVVPNNIKQTWKREFNSWTDRPVHIQTLEPGTKPGAYLPGELNVLVCGVESLSSSGPYGRLVDWLSTAGDFMMVVDESSTIKNPRADRTKRVLELGKHAKYRMILTGTPITQGIHDFYSQFAFLDPNILGYNSYYSFKNRYVVERERKTRTGQRFTQIVGYQNVPELMGRIAEYTDQLRVADVVDDLPTHSYQTLWVKPTEGQKSAMRALKDDAFLALEDGKELTVQNSLELLLRLQQVAGGHAPYKNEDGEFHTEPLRTNPKKAALREIIEGLPEDEKVIIWCRYRDEMADVFAMCHEYGAAVAYHGGIDKATRDANEREFQGGDARFFVGNPATGGMGLELSAAGTVIYYSNSFSYADRAQSEARAQHIAKKSAVQYIDIFLDVPVEKLIQRALEMKTSMAAMVSEGLKQGDL